MRFINKKLFLFLIFSLFFVTGFLLFHNLVQAQTSSLDVGLQQVAATGLPSGDIRTIVAKIIKAALGLLGIVALCLILYAGYLWMTSGGDDEKIGSAKKILINATIGLAIILSSYAIVSYVMNKLVGATAGGGDTACQIQKNAGGASCGGQCPACVVPPCPYGNCDGNFKIVQMPATGNVCIQNVAPVIVFNMDVDVSTLKDKIIVENASTSVLVVGDWSWQTNYHKVAYFKPTNGACPAPDVGKDCFAASTTYKLKIKNSGAGIQSADGKVLSCPFSAGQCSDVAFITGDGVDRKNPTISIAYPKLSDVDLKQGSDISVKINFADDGGLQNMLLNVDGILVDSKNFSGCQKSGTATVVWPTNKLNIGDHSLKAIGLDWAANSGEDSSVANLKPEHCFNKILDQNLGEKFIDCGGECGVCSGDKCAKDADCTSGFCQKQNANDLEGVCVDKTYISDFSPASAAIGDFVSIIGKNFGANKGHVYFAKIQNPDIKSLADWVEAQVVDCGPGFNNWSDNQIIILVPGGVISGKIAVFNAKAVGLDNFNVKYFDTTGDGFKKVPNFILSNIPHPGICGLLPNQGPVGKDFSVKGKNFGAYDIVKSSIIFGDNTKAKIVGGAAGWADTLILSVVPVTLGNGDYGVKVINNNQSSNTVLFKVSGSNPDAPFISSISAPATTTIGDYLTITGKNFGDKPGAVWFKPNGVLNVSGIDGNLVFPVACKNSFWKDNQIVVKVPAGLDNKNKKFTIQVYNIVNNLNSVLDNDKSVTVNIGDPSPGICGISPVSGPVPFATGKFVTVSGEYLDKVTNFYFWSLGGKSDDISNTLISANVFIVDDKTVTTTPNSKDIISGLAYAYRSTDKKQSNGMLFSAFDCTKNNNTCTDASLKCCTAGADLGSCKSKGDLCVGEFKNSGFVWMFSTKEIIPPPQVVERCDAQTELGIKIPTPSPSSKWNILGQNDADKVCQTALVTVEFSSILDQSTIKDSTVLINSCDSLDVKGVCKNPQKIILTSDSYKLNFASLNGAQNLQPFLSLKSAAGKWVASTTYQVILTDSISAPINKGQILKLLPTNPCGSGTSYCFSFKTGKGDCALKQVVVTPYEFWAKLLESPMRYHSTGGDIFDVFYKGNGLSDQYCIMMDVSGFDWKWAIDNKNPPNPLKPYVTINGVDNKISAQVNTLGNTVGIGVPNESVDVKATASTSTLKVPKTGSSPLTVDLSNPDVVDYWPNCLEACTNAAIGAKFNITMSNHNVALKSPAIKLVQCNDENCLSTGLPFDLESSFNAVSGNTILQIANYGPDAGLLPNKLYQITLSASTTPAAKDSINQLWSAANSVDFNTFSKPYNKVFTWRFKTKKEACKVDHIDVVPKIFIASKLKDLAVYQSQPYAAPDACSKTGQKLNPWTQNWDWTSSDLLVATVTSFKTKGSGAYCTANCILKGSTVPTGLVNIIYPICGNGKIEAGEDCENPSKTTGCGLSCRFLGNLDKITCGDGLVDNKKGEACDPKDPKSSVGCSEVCLRTGSKMQTAAKEVSASICGNGMIGSGEDCDLGISADQNVSTSSMYCSEQCLHLGTRLSSKWCFDNNAPAIPAYGGFDQKDYNFFCNQAYSQCGDGVASPDEDLGCEFKTGTFTGQHKSWCNDRCLNIEPGTALFPYDMNCNASKEGCGENLQNIGSSLTYSVPSVCGDGVAGIGEDKDCETDQFLTNLWHKDSADGLLVDPWVLAVGQAGSLGNVVTTTVSAQVSDITGAVDVDGKKVGGSGKYQVLCGYKTDEDCQNAYFGNKNIGVGSNSCCYFKTKLTSVYPGNTSTVPADFTQNVCINTYIEAGFDSVIDPATLPGNFIIARSAASACTGGLEDVSSTISFLDSFNSSLPWYKNIWKKMVVVIKNLFGHEVNANTWCAGADVGDVQVVQDAKGGSKVLFNLIKPLATSTDYVVILKKGIKNTQGVSIESKPDGKAISWRFKTGKDICQITSVTVTPDQYYFSKLNDSVWLIAKGMAENNKLIQPVAGYSWNYQWGPKNSPYVLISSTTLSVNVVAPQNNNGEVDVHASANITDNKYTAQTGLVGTGKSHIIVFLCENPWPPKDLVVPGQTEPTIIFPYEDKIGNNDGFDLVNNVFNNNAILPANVGKGYFNFSTYYCADNGDTGTVDDLPYLRPAVQLSESQVKSTGVCDLTNTACTTDADCQVVNGFFSGDGKVFYNVDNQNIKTCADASLGGGPVSYLDSKNQPAYCPSWVCPISGSPDYMDWLKKHVNANCYGANPDPSKTNIQQKCIGNVNNFFQDSKAFKRFLFTSDKNNDAIGIQVLANPKHLSPSDWFNDSFGKEAFQVLPPIDGNKAIAIGNNIYVGALNFDSNIKNGNLFTNIYLFSINDDATPETKKVFGSLLKNLKFNINLTNYGYCGKDLDNPGDTNQCVSDFDCTDGELCSAQKDKLMRNFSRLQDMGSIDNSLFSYYNSHKSTYPDLKEGTYLSGQTVSTWPSWSKLGNATGSDMPADPINKLGIAGTCVSSTGKFCVSDADCSKLVPPETCVLHTPNTGWSTADKRFSFACANDSLAYRYISTSTSPTSSDYLVKLRLEDPGLVIDNLKTLVDDLIGHPINFNIFDNSGNGICNQKNEITTINQGTCGDGKINLNKGELCDPPGGVVWDQTKCSAVGAVSSTPMDGKMCGDDCKTFTATTTICGILAKCGNGKVEVGEKCDEGALYNGKYNHCNLTCSGLTSSCGDGVVNPTYEVCDTKFDYYPDYLYAGNNQNFGWCISGLNDAHPCKTDFDCKILPEAINIDLKFKDNFAFGTLGKCVPTTFNNSRYGLEKSKSCNFDCQKNGPYCGDGIVQAEFGEECDGDKDCTINGVSGSRVCGWYCRWDYHSATTSPILYYDFDDVFTRRNGWSPTANTVDQTVIGDLSFILNNGSKKAGKSTLNAAKCSGTASTGCPYSTPSADANKNQAMYFNGTSNYFIIDKNQIFDLNEITFATWINIDSTMPTGWNPIFTKTAHFADDKRYDNHNRDFGFYFYKTASGTIDMLHLYSSYYPDDKKLTIGNPPKSNDITIFGVSGVDPKISVDQWHHIAVTVNAKRETRYYIDGILMNPGNLVGTVFTNGSTTLKADHNYDLWIGRGDESKTPGVGESFFKGKMDQFHLFGRALSSNEITDLYKNGENFCEANVSVSEITPVASTGCGNGKIDTDEICDNGAKNGVPCTPGYNKDCTYCLAGCKNTKQIKATEYCGDGVINGSEVCDVDKGIIISNTLGKYYWNVTYASSFFVANNGYVVAACSQEYNLHLNTYSTANYNAGKISLLTSKIGSRTCINDCSIINNKCVECGMKSDGLKVSGNVLNILDTESINPLLASDDPAMQGKIDLVYSKNGQDAGPLEKDGVASYYYKINDTVNPFVLSANINSDPICSDVTQDRSYRIALNDDLSQKHLIDFNAFGAVKSDKNNLLLSPVINSNGSNTTDHHVRVVVSWTEGANPIGGLVTGFLLPGGVSYQGNSITSLEDFSPAMTNAIGADYYTTSPSPFAGIWRHGFKDLTTINTESFTVNTFGMATSAYAFYLHTGSPISNLKYSANLKVEIYMPENDTNPRHFARPVKTYFLTQALPSENAAAQYWHVFNIKKVVAGSVATLDNSVGDINMIRSFIKMNYSTP